MRTVPRPGAVVFRTRDEGTTSGRSGSERVWGIGAGANKALDISEPTRNIGFISLRDMFHGAPRICTRTHVHTVHQCPAADATRDRPRFALDHFSDWIFGG